MDKGMDVHLEQPILKIPIFLKESQGIERKLEPVSFGIPFKKGQAFDIAHLAIYDGKMQLPVDIEATAYWSDKSIKWAFFNSQIDLTADKKKSLTLTKATDPIKPSGSISVTERSNSIYIHTGTTKFILGKNCLVPISSAMTIINEEPNYFESAKVVLKDAENSHLVINTLNHRIKTSGNGLKVDLMLEGVFLDSNNSKTGLSDTNDAITFLSHLTFYAGKSLFKWQFTLTNPNAAVHPGGKWDLGDAGSFYFNDLSVEIPLPKASIIYYKEQPDSNWYKADSQKFSFFQCSSGGNYWDSPNHVNFKGDIPIKFKGFCILNGKNKPISGKRASPLIAITSNEFNFSAQINNFWQEFPKALSLKDDKLRLSLFPEEFGNSYELQGGEQKTHSVFFDFSDNKDALLWCANPIETSFSPSYISLTNAVPWLSSDLVNNPLTQLIHEKGLYGTDNFFAKRETIDEFGWRNFGEVYADHENLGRKCDIPLISHYNNQYDPLFGFIRMFLQSGEPRWFELMNDLANHIVDIDIYHTDQDRYEYNRGLFWHTDHYLDAETCTHRTFSKHHSAAYQDHTGGGGPGDEHCYTAGLVTHYFLTGCQQSKTAVINLARWFINLQEGQGLLLERIQQAKKKDLVIFKRVMKGEQLAKIKYPLTRGTGNYISTLMDAYSLTEERHYFELVESVIRQTIHPNEDISLRHLENKELNWSYIIVLQSLAKYLEIKSGMDEYDNNFYYARDSLLNLTEWMIKYEHPFLEKPDILEFPNMTWVAQDLRKAHILFITSQYTEKHDVYIENARYYLDYVVQKLQNNEESKYTRILVLLMQNQGPEGCFPLTSIDKNKYRQIDTLRYGKAPRFSLLDVVTDLGFDLLQRLMKISISKEMAWLKYRIG